LDPQNSVKGWPVLEMLEVTLIREEINQCG
jgi:hypothetical protein